MNTLGIVLVALALSSQASAFLPFWTAIRDALEQGNSDSQPTTCECGAPASSLRTRIINGVKTTLEGPLASVVQILDGTQRLACGGSLITPQHVISAAHCVVGQNISELTVVVGNPFYEYRANKTTESTQKVGVEQIYFANFTGPDGTRDDISIVKLQEPVTLNKYVKQACLPKDSSVDYANTEAIIAGWGFTSTGQTYLEDQIHKGKARILSADLCHQYWNIIPAENPKKFCIQSLTQKTAQGDSGGPVFAVDPSTNRYTNVGIVSFGLPPGNLRYPIYPRVNTRIASFIPFIKSTVESTSEEQICTAV